MESITKNYERHVTLDIRPALKIVLECCENGYALPSDLAEIIRLTLKYIEVLEHNNQILREKNFGALTALTPRDIARIESYYLTLGRDDL